MAQQHAPAPKLIRMRDVTKQTSLSRSSIYRLTRSGDFPRPIQFAGSSAVAWVAAEVDAWIADRIAERDAGGAA